MTVDEIVQVTADNEKQRFSMKPAHPPPPSSEQLHQPQPSSGTAETADASYWLIRANQGHSIKLESDALLQPITLDDPASVPPVVVHGTYFAFWPRIVESGGLRRMGRNHVHCSTGLPPADAVTNQGEGEGEGRDPAAAAAVVDGDPPAAVISGMRRDAELLIYLDVRRSLEDGALTWWRSENGVVLTEGVGEEGLVPAKYFKEVVGRRRRRGEGEEVVVGTLWKDGVWVADLPESVRSRPPPAKAGRGRGGGGRGGGGGGGKGRGRGRGRGQ